MSNNLFAMCTFGNLDFTKLALESISQTSENQLDFFVVVGKPDDKSTMSWLESYSIPYKYHNKNMGFPYSLNDIYDYAWKDNDYDNLIIAGNDIVAYPNCIDSLINLAENSEYEVISALQYDVKSLVAEYPDTRKYFGGSNYLFTNFSSKPWEVFTDYNKDLSIADMKLFDIQNLCLYKKSVFDKIGYTDVNFFPAYFVDNDYARRIVISGMKSCTLTSARFFHFWSRTIHQEKGGSSDKHFKNNQSYYRLKWGGDFGKETLTPSIKIDSRLLEEQVIDHWRKP